MKKEVDLAMMINNQTYIDYLDRLKMLACSLFSWENLDEVCGFGAENFLEQSLYELGKACFVKDDEIGFQIFRAIPSDKLNNYYLPIKVTAFSIGYSKEYDLDDIVYIMNNKLQLPTVNTLQLMAYRLFDTERTIDVNLTAQKTPVLIEGDTKNLVFNITDKELIEKTGGIIQGMSGSPILQNGKLIGAVTHVLVNDPTRGYGIFIETMLEHN